MKPSRIVLILVALLAGGGLVGSLLHAFAVFHVAFAAEAAVDEDRHDHDDGWIVHDLTNDDR